MCTVVNSFICGLLVWIKWELSGVGLGWGGGGVAVTFSVLYLYILHRSRSGVCSHNKLYQAVLGCSANKIYYFCDTKLTKCWQNYNVRVWCPQRPASCERCATGGQAIVSSSDGTPASPSRTTRDQSTVFRICLGLTPVACCFRYSLCYSKWVR